MYLYCWICHVLPEILEYVIRVSLTKLWKYSPIFQSCTAAQQGCGGFALSKTKKADSSKIVSTGETKQLFPVAVWRCYIWSHKGDHRRLLSKISAYPFILYHNATSKQGFSMKLWKASSESVKIDRHIDASCLFCFFNNGKWNAHWCTRSFCRNLNSERRAKRLQVWALSLVVCKDSHWAEHFYHMHAWQFVQCDV